MKTFKVSFTIVLDDEASHPRKWIPDTLWSGLRHDQGEDIDNYVFEEVEPIKDFPLLDEAG